MSKIKNLKSGLHFCSTQLLSKRVKHGSEVAIVSIAIFSFLLHLLLIALVKFKFLEVVDASRLLSNPIAAIYTPFSFILIYEVYLLVYYLPKSTSIYIGKQYEIVTLIVIRRIFKDLSQLEFSNDWFKVPHDLQFTFDLVCAVALFFLIFVFYRLNQRKFLQEKETTTHDKNVSRFIWLKTVMAALLVPVFLALGIFSLTHWIHENFFSLTQAVDSIKDINKIFFDEFFTILILIDVLLLLISFIQSDKFNKVIRNSGFIVSTVLIKLSFSVGGVLNPILLVVAVLFGILILKIHNLFEELVVPD